MAVKNVRFILTSLICCLLFDKLKCVHQSTQEIYDSDYNMGNLNAQKNKCELIKIDYCKSLPYNATQLPNLLGHRTQDDAGQDITSFMPLVKIKCSPDLEFFLCTLYFPLCTILEFPLPPCRHVCESARVCEEYLKQFEISWPEAFECSKFPENTNNALCVSDPNSSTTATPTIKNTPVPSNKNVEKHRDIGFVCPVQLQIPPGNGYSLWVGGKEFKNCGAPCHSLFFNEEQRTVLRYWVGSWAAVCCASCLFTVLTFLIDSSRFRYPERPIVFLAICYLIVGCAFVAGLGAGDTIACREPFPPRGRHNLQMSPTITMGHRQASSCTMMFMALYFCSMAAFAWWACLTLAWFLAAGLKWGHEAIENKSHLFHMVAWTIPALQTICVLALGKVEGDVLSGVCFLGHLDPHALAKFILIPLCIYLSVGAVFLLAGFVSLFKIRTVMKHDGTRTDKLERLMMRIGFFSGVFIIPSLGYLACLFYEYSNFDDWMVQWNWYMCKRYSIPCPVKKSNERPIFLIYMAKYVCSMLVGVTSSVWLWSGKTVISWRMFVQRLQGKETRNRGHYV